MSPTDILYKNHTQVNFSIPHLDLLNFPPARHPRHKVDWKRDPDRHGWKLVLEKDQMEISLPGNNRTLPSATDMKVLFTLGALANVKGSNIITLPNFGSLLSSVGVSPWSSERAKSVKEAIHFWRRASLKVEFQEYDPLLKSVQLPNRHKEQFQVVLNGDTVKGLFNNRQCKKVDLDALPLASPIQFNLACKLQAWNGSADYLEYGLDTWTRILGLTPDKPSKRKKQLQLAANRLHKKSEINGNMVRIYTVEAPTLADIAEQHPQTSQPEPEPMPEPTPKKVPLQRITVGRGARLRSLYRY